MIESASRGCLVSTDISLRIWTYGLNFLICKLDEFEAELTPEVSDEMTSATEMNQLTWYVLKNMLLFSTAHTLMDNISCDKSDMWPFSKMHSNVIIVFHI